MDSTIRVGALAGCVLAFGCAHATSGPGAEPRAESLSAPTPASAAASAPADEPDRVPAASLVIGGFGAMGIIGGVAFGVASAGNARSARNSASPGDCVPRTADACVALQSKVDAASTFNAASIASYATGGVLLAVAVVTGIVWLKPKPSRPVLTPAVGSGGASLTLEGAF